MPDHPLADLIADHLNGHLDNEQSAQVNAALRDDPVFRELVEQEAKLRAHIQASAPSIDHPPDQLAFERALHNRRTKNPRPLWLAGGMAVAASALIAVGFVVLDQPTTEDDYETLTDPTEIARNGTLRIAVESNADLARLIAKYDLELVAEFPDLRAAMVRLPQSSDIAQMVDALQNEAGVRFVEYD